MSAGDDGQGAVKASRVLLVGIVAVCVLAVIGTACAGRDAVHSKAPAGAVQSTAGVVVARPGPAPLIPPPDGQATGPMPDVVRAPAIRPDTVVLDTLAREGKPDVLP